MLEEAAARLSSSRPSLDEILDADVHEATIKKRRVRRKRATDGATKERRSLRLAEKEEPYYVDAASKATRAKAARMDLSKASERMRAAIAGSRVLERPPPKHISAAKLRCMGRLCGLGGLEDLEDEVEPAAP